MVLNKVSLMVLVKYYFWVYDYVIDLSLCDEKLIH